MSNVPSNPLVCVPRSLKREKWTLAAKKAIEINPDNKPPDVEEDAIRPGDAGERLALDISRYWGVKGVRLTVGFLDDASAELRRRILSHMNAWSKTANVLFVESDTDPQVRIAREADGYWSYLGTDILLSEDPAEATMNLEGFTMKTPDSEFHRVVRHEAGHTLGFPHEHMRRELIDRLDREKVIASYMDSQNWSREEVIAQLLTPLEESSTMGSDVTDATSIMCYQVDAELTKDGITIPGGDDINELDYEFAKSVYPKD